MEDIVVFIDWMGVNSDKIYPVFLQKKSIVYFNKGTTIKNSQLSKLATYMDISFNHTKLLKVPLLPMWVGKATL